MKKTRRSLHRVPTGAGDYAKSRHEWIDKMSLADLRNLVKRTRSRKKQGRKR